MPIREYQCADCGEVAEIIELPGDDEMEMYCPCTGYDNPMRRLPASPAIHFKGYGWTGKHYHRGLRAEYRSTEDTVEENSNGQLVPKTGAGHDAPH